MTCVNSSLVEIGVVNHRTGVTQMGDLHLGDLPYKESGLILPSSVKNHGWLKEDMCFNNLYLVPSGLVMPVNHLLR